MPCRSERIRFLEDQIRPRRRASRRCNYPTPDRLLRRGSISPRRPGVPKTTTRAPTPTPDGCALGALPLRQHHGVSKTTIVAAIPRSSSFTRQADPSGSGGGSTVSDLATDSADGVSFGSISRLGPRYGSTTTRNTPLDLSSPACRSMPYISTASVKLQWHDQIYATPTSLPYRSQRRPLARVTRRSFISRAWPPA